MKNLKMLATQVTGMGAAVGTYSKANECRQLAEMLCGMAEAVTPQDHLQCIKAITVTLWKIDNEHTQTMQGMEHVFKPLLEGTLKALVIP